MNGKTLALLVFSVSVAVALAACPAEPPPPCPVAAGSPLGVPAGGSPLSILPEFWVQYKLTSANTTDTCAQLAGEEVGWQKFSTPGNLTKFTLAARSYRMSYQQGNALSFGSAEFVQDFVDDSDPANPVPGTDLVLRADPNDPDNKKMSAMFDLTPFPDSANLCKATETAAADEDFAEVDFQLVDGGTASTPADPNEPLTGTAIIVDDGGVATAIFPELHEKYDWKDVEFISTTAVPGSVFQGTLNYTQNVGANNCTATYAAFGVWPLTVCRTDIDCRTSPQPGTTVCHNACDSDFGTTTGMAPCDKDHPTCNTDGVCETTDAMPQICRPNEMSIATRQFQGSGLNPSFEDVDGGFPIKCHNDPRIAFMLSTYGIGGDWGICELTMSFDRIQKGQ
jgi:hypothetical protein